MSSILCYCHRSKILTESMLDMFSFISFTFLVIFVHSYLVKLHLVSTLINNLMFMSVFGILCHKTESLDCCLNIFPIL